MSFNVPAIRASFPFSASSIAGPSRLGYRLFSTTNSNQVSKRKLIAKRRKNANLELQSSKIQKPEFIDPILGKVHYKLQSTRLNQNPINEEELKSKSQSQTKSKLSKILLNYEEIAYSPPPNYFKKEEPNFYLPGISNFDKKLLFGALPHLSTELKLSTNNNNIEEQEEIEPNKKTELLMRILDLRNSNKQNFNFLNRQRVIDEFGKGKNTGSSDVQAALLTAKILNLLSHINQNPKDISNKRSLRLLVQQRARHLKYFKRTNSVESYDELLSQLDLERGAVEGELRFNF
ncbi:mitochondrial 37S ribosomal protein uS15m [Kwoniella pini CBS 10737]|uniref:Ribosomal protein S15 n=1 Tax=Kwoniella pini CBS 10737 TaxID=1296096 RepID=A0A1B9HTV9_9TREE|nr:ribosomal protein S15 [Kwoniella pini CBS 10737]OCF46706.1 ribosomal protein S15 [Kwoniella pini CBS 10737]